MSGTPDSWLEQLCANLVPIERETIATLGEEAAFFLHVANDSVTVTGAIRNAYPAEQSSNVVFLRLMGLFKEAYWFHFLLMAGNYPLLLGRLRLVWESVFRAYFVEHYPLDPCTTWPSPGPTVDDKLAWLDEREAQLNRKNCIEPVLRSVFPDADREQTVRDECEQLFKRLHRYAHPSVQVLYRMIGDSSLQIVDSFDAHWAAETVEVARNVFDLTAVALMT